MLGLEGGGLEADESIEGHHDDQAALLRQRGLHAALSTPRLLLVIDQHAVAGEPAIGDESEMARLSLRAEQCRIEGTWQEHAGLRKFRETPWNGACFLHLELTVVRAAHGMGKWSMAHRSCWKVHE